MKNINIDWFRYFVVVCETQSFREASEKIGITSPALSKAILELENYYKVTLIKRKNKFEGLTPAGELLFKLSKNLISNISDMDSEFNDFILGEPQGNVSICSEALVQNYILPKIIIKLIKKYPRIYPKMYSMILGSSDHKVRVIKPQNHPDRHNSIKQYIERMKE
ncbi:MAG: LysR family transcriptional regulator, partial [Candidatus Sericytochromatia bacterium]